ncbi:MAG: ABC transporter substrate-binding protein [Clostridia bacterium]|nr:ABC transporter substrate-binding protein [Clostridia bacterium]
MKNTVKKLVAAMLVVVLAVTAMFALTSCGETNYAKDNTEFIIGLSGPLTGGASVYGIAVKNSAEMAVEEINAMGGINGMKFKLVSYDDQHDSTLVNTGYASMFEGGMQVSLGCVTSAPCLEFAALSAEDNLFFLTPSASADSVPAEDNAYQMCFADGNQGSVAAKYVNSLGKDTIGIFYKADDPYSKGIYDQFKASLNSSITTVEANFTGDADNFSTQIDKLAGCDFIFMPIYYGPAQTFMTQAKGKIADDATYYGCDGFDGIDSPSEDSTFDINEIPQAVQMLSHFNSKATDGDAKEYIDKYVAKFGASAPLNQFGASAYDCVYAIYYAMKAAYEADNNSIYVTMSPSALCDILKDSFNGGFTFNGATGTNIKWESTGFVNKQAIAYSIKAAD